MLYFLSTTVEYWFKCTKSNAVDSVKIGQKSEMLLVTLLCNYLHVVGVTQYNHDWD